MPTRHSKPAKPCRQIRSWGTRSRQPERRAGRPPGLRASAERGGGPPALTAGASCLGSSASTNRYARKLPYPRLSACRSTCIRTRKWPGRYRLPLGRHLANPLGNVENDPRYGPILGNYAPFNRAWGTLVLAGFDVKVTRLERRPAPVMGIVVGQYPPPGRITRRNARVRLTVHHPREPSEEEAGESPQDGRTRLRFGRRSRVPDVRGLPFSEAWEKLTLADFGVRVDRSRGDPRPVVGAVTAQHPPPGTMAAHRTSVRLTVAPAPPADS
jgi:PASTA domain